MANGSISEASIVLRGRLNPTASTLTGRLNNASVMVELYDGEYNVIPKVDAQELETANKLMGENVVIQQIPFYSVSNDANGSTIIIGGDLNG